MAADNVLDEASRNAMGWRYSWGLTISCWSWSTLHHLWFYWPRLFCPSVKQKSYQTALQRVCPGTRAWAMFQSNKGCYTPYVPLERSLALRSSILFTKDWTLLSRILGRGGLWALSLSLLRIPMHFPCASWSVASGGYSGGLFLLRVPKDLQWPRWIRG